MTGRRRQSRAWRSSYRNTSQPGGPPVVSLIQGKVNLVWFWATWSEPGQGGRPAFDAAHVIARLWRSRGLAIESAISVEDDAAGIPDFMHGLRATFPVAWDAERAVAQAYGFSTEPSFYLVDRTGVVRFINFGYHDGDADELQRKIEALL